MEAKEIDKPWLQGFDSDRIYVLLESDSPDDITLYFAPFGQENGQIDSVKTLFHRTTNYGSRTYIHRFLLTDLVPELAYSYWFSSSVKYSFTLPKKTGEITFANMGDNRSNPKVWNKVIENMAADKPDFMIFNGDLAYKKEYNYWVEEFFTPTAQSVFTEYPFVNSIGNHEGWNDNSKAFLQSLEMSKEPKEYFAFEQGEALFLILNTEVGVGPNSSQWKFAKDQLNSTDKQWKIVVFHIPAYSSGAHGENKNMKRMTSKIFEKYGVDLILTGHSHYYQRNVVNGINHLVIGGGGSPLYSPKKAKYTVSQAKKYHHAIVTVNKKKIAVEVKDLDMKTIDKFELIK
jgi:predicted phosphodiesterase